MACNQLTCKFMEIELTMPVNGIPSLFLSSQNFHLRAGEVQACDSASWPGQLSDLLLVNGWAIHRRKIRTSP